MLAEMIVTGAKVLTMDPAQPRAEAVALAGGKIIAVGSDATVMALRGPATQVIEAGGRTLLPGFVESHMHLFGGAELQHLQLTGLHGHDALRAAFIGYAQGREGMLMAEGADYSLLPGGVTRHDLDAIFADRPIALRAMDHHTVWANTKALELTGLLHGAEMPMGHEVVMQTIVYTTNDRIIGPWEMTATFPSEIVNPRALDMLTALIHSEEEE